MFVINSNQSEPGAWQAMNGFIPFKTDGSEYRLFPIANEASTSYWCGCNCLPSYICNYSTKSCISPNLRSNNSYYSEYPANDMDDIIVYPEHYTGFFCGYSTQGQAPFLNNISIYIDLGCPSGTSGYQECYSDLDGCAFYRFIGQRKFNCGDIVGKTITGKMLLGYEHCGSGMHYACSTNYAFINSCPFGIAMDVGLIHKDGTQNPLFSCKLDLPWGCLSGCTRVFCDTDMTQCPGREFGLGCFLPGVLDTNGIEAQDGDRLYIEFKGKGGIKMQYWTCAANTCINQGHTNGIAIGSTTNAIARQITSGGCYTCCLRRYTQYYTSHVCDRYEGIGVSVDQS